MSVIALFIIVFFFNDTATTELYTLSLHDALPIYPAAGLRKELRSVSNRRQQHDPVQQEPGYRAQAHRRVLGRRPVVRAAAGALGTLRAVRLAARQPHD